MKMSEIVASLQASIQDIANPDNSVEDKIEAIENALRDIAEAFEQLRDVHAELAR